MDSGFVTGGRKVPKATGLPILKKSLNGMGPQCKQVCCFVGMVFKVVYDTSFGDNYIRTSGSDIGTGL